MTTTSSNDLNSSSLNIGYVEIDKLLNQNASESTSRKQTEPLRESSSKNDFIQLKKLANNNKKENDRLKQMLRNGNWSPIHPIRKNLWTSLLELNKDISSSNQNKENPNVNKKKFISNESEYVHYLNQIFGTCKSYMLVCMFYFLTLNLIWL